MTKRPFQHNAVTGFQPFEPLADAVVQAEQEPCPGGVLPGEEPCSEGGHGGKCDENGHGKREADRQRHVVEHDTSDSRNEQHGNKHNDRGERGGGDGHRYLVASLFRRLHAIIPEFVQPEDVFEHDDAVVDKHSHGKCESCHADNIERDSRCIHDREREHHGNRDGDTYDQRAPDIPQEDQQHENCQTECLQGVRGEIPQGILNVLGLVKHAGQGEIARNAPRDFREDRFHGAHCLHGICVRLLADDQHHTGLSVNPRFAQNLLEAVGNIRDITQADHLSVFRGQHDVANLLDGQELAKGPDGECGAPIAD
ncbi:MAG: hypothetical protein BWY06_03156 [Candidatus Latescibacteria bacterium ADurb.Bin168]|nr:MAG: hypothetical protein BWY06_03156 [Candidatus Latescibacteria bacterium ADurb.Bin168]